MINNASAGQDRRRRLFASVAGAAAALLLVACERRESRDPEALQGIVEVEQAALAFELPGRISEVRVRRGDGVRRGTVLAALDTTLERALRDVRLSELDQAAATLSLLEAGSRREDVRSLDARLQAARASEALLDQKLGREQGLLLKGVATPALIEDLQAQLARARAERESLEFSLRALRQGPRQQEIEGARARVAAARAALALQEARLARHQLLAPRDGVVLDVHLEPGEIVAPGTPVVTFSDPSRPYAEIFVPQAEIGRVRLQAPASVTTDAAREPIAAVVEHIATTTEFTPRYLFSERERPNLVVRVRVRILDERRRLHAGVPAFVILRDSELAQPSTPAAGDGRS